VSFAGLKITNLVDTLLAGHDDPDAVVLLDPADRRRGWLSTRDLDEASAGFAGWLQSRQIGLGDPVLVLQPFSIRLYAILLGILRAGATAVFVDPNNLRPNIRAACRELKPLAVVGPSRVLALGWGEPALRKIPYRIRTSGWLPGATPFARCCRAQPAETTAVRLDETAIITFSTGPAGYPLGAVRSHAQLLEQHAAYSAVLSPLRTSVTATNVPMAVLSNLALGVPSVLIRSSAGSDLKRLLEADLPLKSIGKGRVDRARTGSVNRLIVTPSMASPLIDSCAEHLGGIDDLIVTGPIFPDQIQSLDQCLERGGLRIVYGHPEIDPIAELACADMMSADRLATSVGRGVLVGRPVPEIRVAILPDDYGLPLGPFSLPEFKRMQLESGEIGEIVVSADHMVSSYVNGRSEAETKFYVDGRIWHRTGDAGMLDSQGRLWVMGRCLARMEDELGITYPLAVEAAARC